MSVETARMRLELFANMTEIKRLTRINREIAAGKLKLTRAEILDDSPTEAEYCEELEALTEYSKALRVDESADESWEETLAKWTSNESQKVQAEWAEAILQRQQRERREYRTRLKELFPTPILRD